MLSFAYKEEERLRKDELEKRLFPLWLAEYALSKMQGNEPTMDFEQFMSAVFEEPGKTPVKAQEKKTAEDIMSELMPLVEADKKRGG